MLLTLEWLFYFFQLLLLASLVWKWEGLKGALRIFALVLISGMLVQLWVRWEVMHNRPYFGIFNAYSILETALWCAFYSGVLRIRNARYWGFAGLMLYVLSGALVLLGGFNPFQGKSLVMYSIEAVLIILFSIRYFYTMVVSDEVQNPLRSVVFWIVAGNFLFYGVCWISSSLYHLVENKYPDIAENFLNVLRFANIAVSLVYIYAIQCLKPAENSSLQ